MIWLLVVHFVSDFVLQRREVAAKKSYSITAMVEHITIIFMCYLWCGWEFSLYNALVHLVIDATLWNVYKEIRSTEGKHFKYWEDSLFYTTIGFDQFLHVATLVILGGQYGLV